MELRMCLVVVVLILAACGSQQDHASCNGLLPESSFLDRNSTLKLSIPPHLNSFEPDDLIEVQVENNANTLIEVVPDHDLKIYVWKEDSWSVVENNIDYLSKIERISPKSDDDPGLTVYAVMLSLSNEENPVRVCITLEGLKDPDGSRTNVAAHIEVVLNP